MIFRKIICIFAIILSIGISISCRPVFAQEEFVEDNIIVSDSTTSDGFIYNSYDGEVTITGHTNKNIKNLQIPSVVAGLPVTIVAGFNNYDYLSSVTFPENIKYISGFTGCKSLKIVDFPSTEICISSYSFGGTPFINNQKTTVKYGGSLNLLSGEMTKTIAITCDENATSVIIEEGTLYIADHFLDINNEVKSIVVPSSVKKIPTGFASNCYELTSVTLSEGITTIGLAFSNCKNLKSITIPASVTKIEDDVVTLGYYLSNDMKDVKIPGFTITGYSGTAAEAYAKKHGFKFVAIGEALKGDANMDGSVNVDDASLVLSYYAKKSAGLNPGLDKVFSNIKLGDVDENSSIDVDDASKILNYYAKEAAGLTPTWD